MSDKTKTNNSGQKMVGIVGTVVSGKSYDSHWCGKCTGSETVLSELAGKEDIMVYINSQGGSVFAGFEILNALSAAVAVGRKVDIYVSALAASIASYIAIGVKGATVHVAENTKMMFHAPWGMAIGSKDEFRDYADLLEKMENDLKAAVSSRGATPEDSWFAAGRMKWFSAKECLEKKLVDHIVEPPSMLIEAVSASASYSDEWDDSMNKSEQSSRNDMFTKKAMFSVAAKMEFNGYIFSLCQEHYGEDKVESVSDIEKDTFELTFKDGTKLLLKFEKNVLNIVDIKWESSQNKNMELNMSDKTKTAEEIKALADAEAKVVADADTKKKADAEAKILADAEAKQKTDAEAKQKTDAEAKKKADATAGLTPDMIKFAKANYEETRSSYIATIKANPANRFSDEQLDGFDYETLGCMAELAIVVEKDADGSSAKPKADTSIVPPPNGTGKVVESTGSLLPPEY